MEAAAEAVEGIVADFAAGRRLDPLGLELIARALLDGEELATAAANLGLNTEAAYKRRSPACTPHRYQRQPSPPV